MGSQGKTHFNYFGFFASAFTLILGMTACEQPTTFLPGNTDRFTAHSEDYYSQANRVLQADYVFVLDYSSSMSSGDRSQSTKINGLINSMSDFTEYLSNENIDYNIGFINGNAHATQSTSTIANNFVTSLITKDTSAAGLNDILAQVGQPLNQNTNYLLEAALRTMKAQSSSFVRDAAQLVYVFVSDSDDRSHLASSISGSKTTNYYASELRKFKTNADYVSARSFTAGVAADCAAQEYDSAGTRLAQVAQALDSENSAPQCVYTPMAASLFDLARNVTKTTTRFTLRGTPKSDSIRIFVDGVERSSRNSWSYNANSNEVIFSAGLEPLPGSELRIVYQMLYKLSQKPQTGSITVTINNTSIPESSTNGWIYVESENRIEFTGSAAPAQDADVRISYIAI